jgi:hypothetical protein
MLRSTQLREGSPSAALGLPIVFFLGVVTYLRVLQNGQEDYQAVKGINRIHQAYLELAPDTRPYFVVSPHDDDVGILRTMGIATTRWQVFFTIATMIYVINSIIGGVFLAVVTGVLFDAPAWAVAIAGIVGGMAIGAAFAVHQTRSWNAFEERAPILFPSEP